MGATLANQTVVVFGGSSGIGLATAKLAHNEGASVTMVARNAERLKQAAATMTGAEWRVADVCDSGAVDRALHDLTEIDHVFISAGQGGTSDILTSRMEDLRRPFEERVFGTFNIVRAAAPRIAEGSITIMSGMNASRVRPQASAPTAALCAVESLVRTLALDLAPIRVNAIAPGWIDTPRLDRTFGADRTMRVEAIARQLPGKRIGHTDEVASAVAMLMTNRYINGEVLHIDGGGRFTSA